MSKTASMVEDYEKIIMATTPIDSNILFKNLSSLLKNRRLIAINILNCRDEATSKQLTETYDYLQSKIKQLLAI